MSQARCVRMTYSCFNKRLTGVFKELGLVKLTLHKIVHFAKNKIGVVYFQCCVIFDTL